VKIRLWGTEEECQAAAERLLRCPGLRVLSVDGPRADRGASVLVRVYVEARLDPPAAPHVTATAERSPPRPGERVPAMAQRMTGGRRRRALPPGGAR
jgi:hypothetical protein